MSKLDASGTRTVVVTRDFDAGGAERLACEIVETLTRAGGACCIAISKARRRRSDPAARKLFAGIGVEVSDLGTHDPTAIALIRRFGAMTVVFVGPSTALDAAVELRAQCPGVRLVSFQFNDIELTSEHALLAPFLDALIVEGDHVARVLCARGVPPDLIATIPSAIDASRFARPEGDRAAGPIRVGFVGRLDRNKGPMRFVQIAQRLRGTELEFLLVGRGPQSRELRYALLVNRRTRNIRWIGGLPAEEIPGYLRYIDILVVCSRVEGRPRIIQEAQASGTAVVASRIAGIEALVDDGRDGFLCDVEDIDGFAAAVLKLARNPSLRARLSTEGRRRLAERPDQADTLASCAAVILGREPDLPALSEGKSG